MFESLEGIGKNLNSLMNNISTFNDYFWHPSHILKPLWIRLDENSMGIFMTIALIGFLAFCLGFKKGSKITMGSIVGFYIFKCISKVIIR